MPTRTTAIIFDLAEVLIRGCLGVGEAFAELLSVPAATVDDAIRGEVLDDYCRGRITELEYWRRTIERAGWQANIPALQTHVRKNMSIPWPGTAALLERLAGRYRLALLSDHGREWIADILPAHPFLSVLEPKFFSFDLGHIKRDPETFPLVLEALNARPESCLFIDDAPPNVAMARRAGMEAIRFLSAEQLEGELKQRGLLA
jgi:HAD superfamily hydrolase (TIGR01509 family)